MDTTKKDTANATLALKDILGIGALKPDSASNKNNAEREDSLGKTTPTKTTSTNGNGSSKSQQTKSSKKKKKQSTKENSVDKKHSSKKDKGPGKKQLDQQLSNNQGNKKVKKKTLNKERGANKQKQSHPQTETIKPKDENFAWSAFQSPPDPSSLPLPAFENSFSFDDATTNEKEVSHDGHQQQESNNENEKDPVGSPNSSYDKASITPLKKEMEIKAILNISNDNSTKHNEEKVIEQGDSNASSSASGNGFQTVNSNSHGINLATLTISTADETVSNTTSTPPKQSSTMTNSATRTPQDKNNNSNNSSKTDPIAMLMNAQSYGTANPTIHSSNSNPHQYNMYPNNHQYTTQNPSVQHYPTVHSPQHHHQLIPPYYTIQVQVPPVLMPGRRMIVPASPMTGGYPIPVVVPEGVVPGMLIPVSIPNPNIRGNTVVHQHHN